jgi:hypothetical protein
MQPQASQTAPLVVSPKRAMVMLDCGRNRLYDLINDGELESFLDGRLRKITVRSIEARVNRLLKQRAAPLAGRAGKGLCARDHREAEKGAARGRRCSARALPPAGSIAHSGKSRGRGKNRARDRRPGPAHDTEPIFVGVEIFCWSDHRWIVPR